MNVVQQGTQTLRKARKDRKAIVRCSSRLKEISGISNYAVGKPALSVAWIGAGFQGE